MTVSYDVSLKPGILLYHMMFLLYQVYDFIMMFFLYQVYDFIIWCFSYTRYMTLSYDVFLIPGI